MTKPALTEKKERLNQMVYDGISESVVLTFKTERCDENGRIADLLQQHFAGLINSPILDVGAGLGDISARVFPLARVTLLDVIPYVGPLSSFHERVVQDFFAFASECSMHYDTVLLSHVVQYLDSDRVSLEQAIASLSPRIILIVANSNNDFLGELINWAHQHFAAAINPEIHLDGFPSGYICQKSVEFTADLVSADFNDLAEQVAYLFDYKLSQTEREDLSAYLSHRLSHPQFTINQNIAAFIKEN